MKPAALEQRLLSAHAGHDLEELVELYAEAADCCLANSEIEAACFYLTHAFVYALEAGHADTDRLQWRLWKLGREKKPHSES